MVAAALTSPADHPRWPLGTGHALAWFGRALEAVVNGVSVADVRCVDTPLVYVNSAFERLTGYSAAEALGRNCRFLQAGDAQPEAQAAIRRALAAAEPCRVLLRNYRKDGSRFWNDLTLFPVFDEAEQFTHVVGVQNDVSDRCLATELEARRAELATRVADVTAQRASLATEVRELDLRRRFIESILEEMPMGVVTTDAGGGVTFMNRAAQAIVGPPGEAASAKAQAVGLFDGNPELRRALGGGSSETRFEFSARAPDGRPLELAMTVIRASDETSPDFGHVLVFRDVRERRLRTMRRLRDDRLAALGQMAMGFAHEVRNPLAAMSAICEAMALEVGEGHPQRQYAERLLGLVGRMSGIIQSTLHFGRPEPPRFRIRQPALLLDEALDVLSPRFAAAGGQLAADVAPGLPLVRVDGGQIVQALVALLVNALEAVGLTERVRVSLGPYDDASFESGVVFEVSDDGPGIAAEELRRVFDPFYTTKPQGTGLGLAIAQRLVIENGGQLCASSAPGVETKFRLTLPGVGVARAGDRGR
ncbi:MAG: PAS domain-containing protein [Polyangiaceae bacterium]|nr:PAS domain-containing protein [Polyangiaceae bacterium]